ncbi:damage-inducible protein DinB [Actibacterium mucosum KCTC 23349]|uniref:Damage-inducible protein DinB n=1 Tax=Actibacterium mucosum KCTC 23349 TaxID=1454373 RepID=A0A037ZJW1_9RHOB|nr:DinB family protein [Actibacterium mucosum]KAJ55837.1 damage-inducible protein DinB [Actibacterium mucosum KCTC 23349]
MITREYVQTMARYNAWQNTEMLAAAEAVGDAARQMDRGAFFGSIMRTMSHLLWGDQAWMSRFDNAVTPPEAPFSDSAVAFTDWATYRSQRVATDAAIAAWAGDVTQETLDGDLTWFSGMTGSDMSRQMAVCVAHLFNHQTHHRGQINAMLTAAGAKAWSTDLPFMPDA